MANINILASPASDSGTFSGGSWSSSLPLVNLKNQQPTKVARSTNATTGSTKFVVDLGSAKPVSMIAIIANNFTDAATIRYRVSNASDGSSPLLDTTGNAYDVNVVFGSLPWGGLPWSGVIQADRPGGPTTFFVADTTVFGRYILIDITDTTNPAGYVQIGRFMAGESFAPAVNFSYGAALRWIDESTQSRSIGGSLWSYVKPRRRMFSCSFDFLNEAEAYGAAYDLQRNIGITGNMLVVYDPVDITSSGLRRTIYGRMLELDDIVTANPTNTPYTWRLAVEELL